MNYFNKVFKNQTYLFYICITSILIIFLILKDTLSSLSYPIFFAYWLLSLFFFIILFGYRKNKSNYLKRQINSTFLLCLLIYIIITYLLGFSSSFIKITYNLKHIISIIYLICLIILKELFRYTALSKSLNSYKLFIINFFLFVLYDLTFFSLTTTLNKYNLIALFITSITTELLLTYTSRKYGYVPCLTYCFFVNLLPELIFYPDIGLYLKVIFSVILNSLLFFLISKPYRKSEMERANTYKNNGWMLTEIFLMFFVFVTIILISGKFKYTLSSIASDSMYPELQRGDGIIVKKLTDEEKDNLKVGDIIAFKDGGFIITHRIIEITEEDGKKIYQTKGDNNTSKDVTKKGKDDIIGIVKIKIPYIGYPSVEIAEIKNK